MNGSQVRIIMDGNNLYLLLPAIKWYIKMSTDDIGLESMDDMMSNLRVDNLTEPRQRFAVLVIVVATVTKLPLWKLTHSQEKLMKVYSLSKATRI